MDINNEQEKELDTPAEPESTAPDTSAEPEESSPAADTASAPAETAEEAPAPAPEQNKKKKKHFTKKRELITAAVSAALGFTGCFFVPGDTFLANQHEFTVCAPRILLPLLAAAVGATLAIFVFLNLVLALNVKLWKICTCLFSGVLLAGYSQIMFMNGRMVQITGDSAPYTEKSTANIVNLVIYAAIMLVPFLLLAVTGDLRSGKRKRFLMKLIGFVSAALFIMQSAGIASRLVKTGIQKKDDSQLESYLSMADTLDLSEDGNVIVFLTDRLDASWLEKVLGDYPELYDELDGFTYYSNNVACYTNTFPSVARMLTSREYANEEWADYLSKCWAGDTMPRRLHENGYRVNLMLDNLTTYMDFAEISDQCDNIHKSPENVDYNYFGPNGILKTMAKISLGRLSPYLAKNHFLWALKSDFSNKFYIIERNDPACLEGSIGKESDIKFYEYLKNNGITVNSGKKTFSFIHLNFSHDSNEPIAQLYSGYTAPVDKYKTTRGGFELLDMYFQGMKDAGVYDSSTIIIIGDHGRPPAEIELDGKRDLDGAVRTAALVKRAGAERGRLRTDADAELSNAYFAATVLDYAGVDRNGFGPSFDDVIAMDKAPERFLKVYCWHGIGNIEDVVRYEITGDSSDFGNWKVVERDGKPVNN